MPSTTEEVAGAVRLFSENQCLFSIKGGGHSTIPGAANIDNGVLMPLKYINATDINFEDTYIRVGAGALFGAIYEALDSHKLAAVVGRVAEVGLGMTIGAGISYFSNELGLVVDNVVEYEVVLANGTVVEASATSHPDLFWALKGGNNNFGIVTHLKLRTLETAGSVFGGVMTYPESSLDQVTNVLYDYHVRQALIDTSTHVLPQYTYNGTTDEAGGVAAVVYNEAVNEVPEILRGWVDIPNTGNTLQLRSNYSDLVAQVKDTSGDGLV